MAKLVEVEHYQADGSVSRTRMRLGAWKRMADAIPTLGPGEFYAVWGDLKRRWDGCSRMTLKGFLVRNGYRVEMESRDGDPVAVVYPDDE